MNRTKKWISITRRMPSMLPDYCEVTSAYQSTHVTVKMKDREEHIVTLQLYGNSGWGWKSEWWKNGMLSDRTKITDVICWTPYNSIVNWEDAIFQTFEEAFILWEEEMERYASWDKK